MKILCIGSSGMLGQSMIKIASAKNIEILGVARKNADYEVDITQESEITDLIYKVKPDIVVNAAAFTSVDLCEVQKAEAYLINARSVHFISEACREINCYFVQISTDHFFTGNGYKAHSEMDQVTLVNEYARTKYLGERFALINKKALVVRTNIVGFRGTQKNKTFLEWLFDSLVNNKPFVMFKDFFTSSIYTDQFVLHLLNLIEKETYGLLNLSSREVFSKHEFIESIAKKLNYSLENATVGSLKRMTGVQRADSLGLDVSKAENILGYKLPTMEEVVEDIVKNLRREFNGISLHS